jgi:hypothetical protein
MTNTDKTVSTERLADARVRFIGAKSRVDDEEMVEVPADYLDEGIAAFTELLASRTQEPAGWHDVVKKVAYELMMHKELRITLSQMVFLDEAVSTALRAASITPPAPERSKEEVGVRVKPLEWREVESTTGSHEIYEATSILGYYRVVGCPDGSWFVGGASAERPPNDATDPKQWCMDWAEKYNRTRILSALEPASLHKGEAGKHSDDCGCGYCT